MFDLDGETAVVTGASRGLGAEAARQLAASGADVAVNYPAGEEQEAAESVRTDVADAGGTAITVEADVSDPAAVDRLFATVADELGQPTVLVNNAGIGVAGPIEEISPEDLDRVLDVDLKGVFYCSQAAVSQMDDDPDDPPRIVNVTSQLAFKGAPELTHYCAAKGGVVSFTRALAREVAPGILVNAVAPGPMNTEMLHAGTSDEWRAAKREDVPLDRFGEPEEVAPSICFLASRTSDYYTGQVLSPDGGDAMH